jgi:Tol biopolymer transport system component
MFSCNTVEPPTPLPEYDSINETPAWSPDGKWIAYRHFSSDVDDTVYPSGIYLIDTSGINRKMIVANKKVRLPDWSPDGEKIVFTNGNIHIVDIDTREINQLTTHGFDFFPSWSPDGSRISFDRSGTSDTVGTWIIDLTTLNQSKLGFFGQLDWSPSGNKIVFSGSSENKNSESQIWLANSEGSNQQKLTSNNFSYNRYPKWSPINNMIAWEISRSNTTYSEIWIMKSDGSAQMKLTDGGAPSWSPNSKKIVYSKLINNKVALFIIDIDTREIKQLTF